MGDDETTVVDYRLMNYIAEKGKEKVQRINECIDDIERWRSILDTMWSGVAEGQFEDYLHTIIGYLKEDAEYLDADMSSLADHASNYAQADGVALAIALSVEQAKWAEV